MALYERTYEYIYKTLEAVGKEELIDFEASELDGLLNRGQLDCRLICWADKDGWRQ